MKGRHRQAVRMGSEGCSSTERRRFRVHESETRRRNIRCGSSPHKLKISGSFSTRLIDYHGQ